MSVMFTQRQIVHRNNAHMVSEQQIKRERSSPNKLIDLHDRRQKCGVALTSFLTSKQKRKNP